MLIEKLYRLMAYGVCVQEFITLFVYIGSLSILSKQNPVFSLDLE